MKDAQLSQEDLLTLNLGLKLGDTIQLIGGLSMKIVNIGPPRNRILLQSTHMAVNSLSGTPNGLGKGSEETVSLTQTTIDGGSSGRRMKLSLNNGRKRVGQKAWNQLGRSLHGSSMHPVILDASLEAVKIMNQH